MPKVLKSKYMCEKCKKDFGNRKSNYESHINSKRNCVTKEIQTALEEKKQRDEKIDEPKNYEQLFNFLIGLSLQEFKELIYTVHEVGKIEKLECILTLFGALGLFPSLKGYRYCIGNFNQGTVKAIENPKEILKIGLTRGGDSADAVFMNESTMIVFTSKNRKNIGVGDYDITDITHYYKENKYVKELVIGICSRSTADVIDKAKKAHKSSNEITKYILNNSETKFLDLQDIVNSFSIFKDNYHTIIDITDNRLPLSLYFHQKILSLKISNLLEKESTVLCGAIPRSGKTYIMGYLTKTVKNTLIITLRPSENLKDLEDVFRKYNFGDYNLIIPQTQKSKPKVGERNIVVCSKQYLQGKTDMIKSTILKWLESIDFDLVLIDEPHDGGCTSISDQVYEVYCKKAKIVFFTSTYKKPSEKYGISNENIVGWNYRDIANCRKIDENAKIYLQKKYGEKIVNEVLEQYPDDIIKQTYSRYPTLVFQNSLFKPETKQEIKDISSDTDFGWSLKSLFLLTENGTFQNEEQVKKLFLSIFGKQKKGNSVSMPDKDCILSMVEKKCKDTGSMFFNLKNPMICLVYLDKNGISTLSKAVKTLLEKERDISEQFNIVCTNGEENGSSTALEIVNGELAKAKNNDKKGVIVLTGRMLSTSATIPQALLTLLLDNSESYDEYYQKTFRCMTEYNGKNYGFVYDLNNKRSLKFICNLASEMYPEENDRKKRIIRLLESRIVELNGDKWYKERFNTSTPTSEKVADYIYDIYLEDIEITKNIVETFKDFIRPYLTDKWIKWANTTFKNGKKSQASLKETENVVDEILGGKDKDVADGIIEKTQRTISEEKRIKNVLLDIFPYIIVYICLFTITKTTDTFVEMCNLIQGDEKLSEICLGQLKTCWGEKIPDDIFSLLVNLYNDCFSENIHIVDRVKYIKERFKAVLHDRKKFYSLIEDYLIPQENERKTNAEISTPPKLRKEMLDKLPQHIWTDKPSILEPCCGKGGFLIDIVDRLMIGLKDKIFEEEKRYKFIVENIVYFCDINPTNIFICKLLLDPYDKYTLNYYEGDTLELNVEEEFGFQFDVVIGNPPYSTDPSKPDTKPLYNLFTEKFIDNCDYLLYITPSRWFSGGKGLDKFRKMMLARDDISLIRHYENSKECFKNVLIEGGVSYFLKTPNKCQCMFNNIPIELNKYDILVEPKYLEILEKVKHKQTIETIFMKGSHYKIRPNDKRLTDEKMEDSVICYVSSLKKKDRKRYIKRSDCKVIDTKWKVITARANGNKKCFGFMTVIAPNEVYTDSYIGFEVKTEKEGLNLISYLKCKLPNFLLASRKISQDISTDTIKWIPLVPLDRSWTDDEVNRYFGIQDI